MKNTLLLLFGIILSVSFSKAQNFSVEPNPAYAEADLDDFSTLPEVMQAIAGISNNTSDTLFLRWERIIEETPEGWKTSVCDGEVCLLPDVSVKEFTLYPNVTNDIWVEAWPGGQPCCLEINGAIPGEGEVQLKITNLNDPSDTLIAVFLFTLTGSPILDLSEIELAQVDIFPNPVLDYVTLTETKGIDRLIIYNVLGRSVKTFDVNANRQFGVGDLPSGSYFVNLIDKDQKTLKTLHLQKR